MPNAAVHFVRRRVALFCVATFCLVPMVAQAEPIAATDTVGLRAHVGQAIEVKGTVTKSGASKQGTVGYLNFAGPHQGVALVFFFNKPGGPKSVDDLKPFVGKTITLTGTLEDFKGDLEIKVQSLDELKTAP